MATEPDVPSNNLTTPETEPPPPSKKERGLLSRLWLAIFGGSDDFEKRLQSLSKEEAAVHARLKRRARNSRRFLRNIVVLSVVIEVTSIIYAIVTTRSLNLSWQMRALRVLPMFLLPGLSALIYSLVVSYTRMVDRKDQRTLEKLRAERKAKIDELKERTNYYTTQQLIQKYDLDPAAKAAAATVLASKLGADSGLKFYVGDESNMDTNMVKSSDNVSQSEGLRNRKKSHARGNNADSLVSSEVGDEASAELSKDGQVVSQGQMVVEHYKGSDPSDGGWLARIAALLVGEDATQCCALICGNCRMHNGLARKEDFPCITYYCPHCHALNASGQADIQNSRSSSSMISPESSSKSSVLGETQLPASPRAVKEDNVQGS